MRNGAFPALILPIICLLSRGAFSHCDDQPCCSVTTMMSSPIVAETAQTASLQVRPAAKAIVAVEHHIEAGSLTLPGAGGQGFPQ